MACNDTTNRREYQKQYQKQYQKHYREQNKDDIAEKKKKSKRVGQETDYIKGDNSVSHG
jgi:hypothetical protein